MNLLEGLDQSDVRPDPFPHVIVRNALPKAIVERLIGEFPDNDVVMSGEPESPRGSNKRFNIYAHDVATEPRVSPLWKEFIAEQSSPRFFAHAVRVFEPWIRDYYPEFVKRCGGDVASLRTGVRFRETFDQHDVLLDAGISINTPVTTVPSSVRMAHCDLPTKLFTGLFYLRPDEDRSSQGGNLVICRNRPDVRPRFYQYEVDWTGIEEIETVPYEKNTFVFFLNSLHSVHAVSPRLRTPHTRRFVNLVVEVQEPLFDSRPYQVAKIPYRLRYYLQQLLSWRRAG